MAFAAAVACRPLGVCERFAPSLGVVGVDRPREVATQLWGALQGDDSDRDTWVAALEEVMSLLPPAAEVEPPLHGLVDDAWSSLVYAIRCLLSPDADEAAWAARCAYEAASRAAMRVLRIEVNAHDAEDQVLAHAWVQRELERQRRDLALLLADRSAEAILGLQQCAGTEELLTEEEGASLASIRHG